MSEELVPVPQPVVAPSGNQRTPTPAEDAIGEAARVLRMDETVQGIAATNPRALGVGVGPQLIAASFSQMSADIFEQKDELRQIRSKLEKETADHAETRIQKARLEEKVNQMESARRYRSVMAVVAAALLSVGVKLACGTEVAVGWILIFLGAILLLVSISLPLKST